MADSPCGGLLLLGYPRNLRLRATAGAMDPATAFEEVRRAIALERRATNQAIPLQVREVRVLDGAQGLWRLEVRAPPSRPLLDWQGGTVVCELQDGGEPWRAEVLHGRRDVLIVAGDPEPDSGRPSRPPQRGSARLYPFDFLAAPAALGTAAFAHLHAAYGQTLLAASDQATSARLADGTWPHAWMRLWGPPGTGKTFTLVQQTPRLLADRLERVLLLSTTNQATDEVAIRLCRQGVEVLRVGALDVQRFRDADALAALPRPTQRLEALERAQRTLEQAESEHARARAALQLRQVRRGMPRLVDLLDESGPRCVATTLHHALRALVSSDMEPFHANGRAPFTTVILDEAGLVPRATAAAAALLAARRFVLVGDPRQLSPICKATRSMPPTVKRWLSVSALDGVQAEDPTVQALTEQHRMHPDIRQVVSALQYDGRLLDAPQIAQRTWRGGRLATGPRALWLVLEDCEVSRPEAERAERSWHRPATLAVLARLLAHYPELKRARGLFISPYRAQAARAAVALPESWSASTVHAQQGAEADVVVFDPVRFGGWGAPEWKRLVNVALSRARELVLVVTGQDELTRQGWLRRLRETLTRARVDANGVLELAPEQVGLFAAATAAEPAPASYVPKDPAGLGAQIVHQRLVRRQLTQEQATLLDRSLEDLGPRLIRGVAGSGKTVVLAHWCAGELSAWPERTATVFYGNAALEPHLRSLLEKAWRLGEPEAALPEARLSLVHAVRFFAGLLEELGLQPPEDRYDLGAYARAAAGHALAPRFDVLYIDEAQDLGHDALALLVSLVRPVDSRRPVRIFYDNGQNIYGRSTPVWARFGLDLRGRSTVLRTSFRATRPAVELALDLLDQLRPLRQDPDLAQLEREGLLEQRDGRWHAHFCAVQGQPPAIHLHDSEGAELAALCGDVERWLREEVRPRDIRILVDSERTGRAVVAALRQGGIDALWQARSTFDQHTPRVVVTTVHSFKGYEAEVVAVVGLQAFHRQGQALTQLLYVALTRARTLLRVSAVRQRHSPLIGALESASTTASG